MVRAHFTHYAQYWCSMLPGLQLLIFLGILCRVCFWQRILWCSLWHVAWLGMKICLGVLCRVCFLAAHSKVQFVACWVARNGICNPVSSCQTYHAICLVTINSQIIRANGLLVAQLWDGNSSLHRVACRSRCKEQLVLVNYLHSVYLLRKWFPKPGGTQGVGLRILDDVISTERITTGFGFFTP
jgi:hypothetical protein